MSSIVKFCCSALYSTNCFSLYCSYAVVLWLS